MQKMVCRALTRKLISEVSLDSSHSKENVENGLQNALDQNNVDLEMTIPKSAIIRYAPLVRKLRITLTEYELKETKEYKNQ